MESGIWNLESGGVWSPAESGIRNTGSGIWNPDRSPESGIRTRSLVSKVQSGVTNPEVGVQNPESGMDCGVGNGVRTRLEFGARLESEIRRCPETVCTRPQSPESEVRSLVTESRVRSPECVISRVSRIWLPGWGLWHCGNMALMFRGFVGYDFRFFELMCLWHLWLCGFVAMWVCVCVWVFACSFVCDSVLVSTASSKPFKINLPSLPYSVPKPSATKALPIYCRAIADQAVPCRLPSL